MSMFKIQAARPLELPPGQRARQMAFDGCHYYFTLAGCAQVAKLDLAGRLCECLQTQRSYDCLCYDTKDCCFWASARACPREIFKLSCKLQEIDSLRLPTQSCPQACGEICGLSYHCCADRLLVAFPAAVYDCGKCCDEGCRLLHCEAAGLIMGILSLAPGYLLTVLRGRVQYIYCVDGEGCQTGCYELPPECELQSMQLRPRRGCAPVLDCFFFKQGCYPYLYAQNLPPVAYPLCRCIERLDGSHCCCEKRVDCEQARADVMESVALMEAALAHILNAEGEKLQRVIAESCDLEQVLCVNREVNRTLIHVSSLENVLYAKLSSLADVCPSEGECGSDCGCQPPPPSCPAKYPQARPWLGCEGFIEER